MEICSKCGEEHERATAEDIDKGMLWHPDEQRWVCQRCWNQEFKSRIVVGVSQ